MSETSEPKETEAQEASLAIWDCGSPLYDSHELVSLDHLIQRHLMAIPSLGGSNRLTSRFYCQCSVQEDTGSSAVTKGDSSSVITIFREFVSRKFRKNGKDKQKRLKNGVSGFCYRFGFRKK